MFKRVIQSLSKSLSRQPAGKPTAKTIPTIGGANPATKPIAAAGGTQGASAQSVTPAQTPEEMCGVTGKMSKDQIRDQLKVLYRRFNRAASSLDATTRAEAERMLDAIVTVREKYLGSI